MPLLVTLPDIEPLFVNVPLFVKAPPILPSFVKVPALSTAPVILPSLSTEPAVFLTLPSTVEFVEIFNTASALFNVTASPVAFVNFTPDRFNVVALVKLNPFWLFKSIVEVFVPTLAPLILNEPAAVVPKALLKVYVLVASAVLNVLSILA